MKKLKYIIFIPVSIIALGIINLAFMRLLNWTMDRTSQWYNDLNILFFILLIPLFWGVIWGIFKLTAIGLAALLIPVSPEKKFSLYALGICSIINCMILIVHYWVSDVDYSWRVILMLIMITAFIVDFSASIVLVFSKSNVHEHSE